MENADYDVLIIGTGPAGLQAAIHAARKKVSVLVLGRERRSSVYGAHLENYCCISGITGEELLKQGRKQVVGAGGVFVEEDVTEIKRLDSGFMLRLEGGAQIRAKAVVIAMGIFRKKLKVPGEKEFLGRGVSYCVECDANFFKGERVALVGGKSAAVSGALTLLFYAAEVHLVYDELDVSEALAGQLSDSAVIAHPGKKVKEIAGKDSVQALVLDDGSRLSVSGVFIELGAKGAIELAGTLGVALDPETMQYIAVNRNQETNIPGIYAAGDICGPPWQVAKSVGEGCVAGIKAAEYAKEG
jgi:thioredoxin reductase (NADPH)